MKRMIALFLCMAMLLAGCGPKEETAVTSQTEGSVGTTAQPIGDGDTTGSTEADQPTEIPEQTAPTDETQPTTEVTEGAPDGDQTMTNGPVPEEPTTGTTNGNATNGGTTTNGGTNSNGGTTNNNGMTNNSGGTSNGGNTNNGSANHGSTGGGTPITGPTGSGGKVPDENGDGVVDIGYDTLPCTEEALYDQLFDLNNEIQIDIDMSATELKKLQSDYDYYSGKGAKSPIYRRADMTVTITTSSGSSTTYRIEDVGVRMKGNTSRTSFYNSQDGIYNYIHLKLDFQETFDDEDYYGSDAQVWSSKSDRSARKDRTFATLEKLEMRWNKCYDSTYLKELYAYELYRDQGVLAPMMNLCGFDWSGVHMGVYSIVEPIDEVFLEKRLDQKDLGGDLYKCGWTNVGASFTSTGSIGIEDDGAGKFYCYDLKTNKKTSSHQSLKNLINSLNSGTVTKESFGRIVDVDNFLSFAAVSYFLGNPDDLRNNYNNFYLYFLKSSGKAIIIPYDYDRCLGVTVDYNPSGHAMTIDDPFSQKRESCGAQQENPLYVYSVDKGGYYVAEFAQVLTRVSGSSLLTTATFTSYFNRAKALYQDDVTPSKTLHNASGRNFSFDLNRTSSASGGSNMSFKDYLTAKMAAFNGYMAKLDQYLGSSVVQRSGFYIRGDFNDWSVRDDYAMELADGKLRFTLSFTHDFKFKIYSKTQDVWLGSECLAEDTAVSYSTDDHTNIILRRGTYLVTFDPETQIITVTKK